VATPSGLTEGSGGVLIDKNLIQGNLGGSADGGGIALRSVNGNDVAQAPGTQSSWHLLRIFNNLIVNNVSGSGGAGISLQDAARVQITHNTIARNDSTATSVFAGIGNPPSVMQPSGIVSRANSLGLQAILGADSYSVPQALRRNIVSQNRTFNWDPTQSGNGQGGLIPLDSSPVFWDLGVVGTAASACLSPRQAVLTSLFSAMDGCDYTGSDNTAFLPVGFVAPYYNDLLASTAADEGGNSVQVYYTPLGKTGDYHLLPTSGARNRPPASSTGGPLNQDVDGQPRPFAGSLPDTGADEVQQ
jgi:parallel beta-helix repeat protein